MCVSSSLYDAWAHSYGDSVFFFWEQLQLRERNVPTRREWQCMGDLMYILYYKSI